MYRTIPSKRSTNVKNVEGVEDVVDADDGRNMSDIVIFDAFASQQPVGEFHTAR